LRSRWCGRGQRASASDTTGDFIGACGVGERLQGSRQGGCEAGTRRAEGLAQRDVM
jgi:hypothetical protein